MGSASSMMANNFAFCLGVAWKRQLAPEVATSAAAAAAGVFGGGETYPSSSLSARSLSSRSSRSRSGRLGSKLWDRVIMYTVDSVNILG